MTFTHSRNSRKNLQAYSTFSKKLKNIILTEHISINNNSSNVITIIIIKEVEEEHILLPIHIGYRPNFFYPFIKSTCSSQFRMKRRKK